MASQISQIKNCVTFIYYRDKSGGRIANGTGFLISVNVESIPEAYVIYLVSAKHVLLDGTDFFSEISISLNRRNGKADYFDIHMDEIILFTHDDPDVDLVVIPITAIFSKDLHTIYDFKVLSEDLITTQQSLSELEIGEGEDAFFCGLFVSYTRQERNQPITRFGKVALISDEKVEYKLQKGIPSKFLDLYLIECLSFGGNSGSPVFFQLNPLRNLRKVKYLDARIYLAGVIAGSYDITEPYSQYNMLLRQNTGIAAVIPSYKLHEILFSHRVFANRNNATEFANYH